MATITADQIVEACEEALIHWLPNAKTRRALEEIRNNYANGDWEPIELGPRRDIWAWLEYRVEWWIQQKGWRSRGTKR